MLDYKLQEVRSLVNHVRLECEQVLLSYCISNDLAFIAVLCCCGHVVCLNFKSFCCYDVVAVTQLKI